MAVPSSSDSWIGASVLRKEDARHLLGHGVFIADVDGNSRADLVALGGGYVAAIRSQ